MRSLRAQLLIGLLLGSLVCTLLATAILYQLADEEADEQSDMQLRQVAWALPLQVNADLRVFTEDDPDDAVQVQMWDGQGRLVYRSDGAPDAPRQLVGGYQNVRAGGERWRAYSVARADYVVQVSQPIAVRQRIAAHMALRIAPPLLLLVPALGLLIWVVVGRALRPLERVAQAVRGRSPTALQAVDTEGLPPELLPIVSALNGLLGNIESAMAAQRNFVADAAHELRSPLTALKLQLQLAERAGGDAARAASFQKLHGRLDRAIHLVQQLLTLARHEHAHAPAPRVPSNLLALAREAVAEHAIHAESKAIDLGVDAGAGEPVMALVQVEGVVVMLSNLVDNALRYTQDGGKVDVTAGVQDGRAFLRVADNGPGVPVAERARLFDRFYRPDGNAVWGCGLGMSIVKSVADDHGAEVRLDSNVGERGLVVTVWMPLSTP